MLDKPGMTYDIANDGLEVFDEAQHQKVFMDVRKLKMNDDKETRGKGG